MTDVRERFLGDVDEHRMTVLLSEGLYRHVKFAKPGTNMYRFDLVTWPGYLSLSGDMGCFVWALEPDMFGFFRSKNSQISPDYWAQKLKAPSSLAVKEFSEPAVRRFVVERFMQERHRFEGYRNVPPARGRLFQELRDQVLSFIESDDEARETLGDFWFEHHGEKFQFGDPCEWGDFTELTYHYLWACHAVAWGINHFEAASQRVVGERYVLT